MSEIRKITLQFPSLRAFLAEYGERLSADGMLLRSESPPADGSRVDVEVIVAQGMRLLRARGEVLWSESGAADGGHRSAAVRFEELDEASRTLIGKILDQRRREGAEIFSLEDVPGPRQARLRDLTVPAAAVTTAPETAAGAPAGSVFDLDQPPAEVAEDLFSAPGDDRGLPISPPAGRRPAGDREPPPPVPLLADPVPESPAAAAAAPPGLDAGPPPRAKDTEEAPFDLGSPPAAEEPAEPPVEAAPAAAPAAPAHDDLSDLFGGDEPEAAPPRGHTEAFPASFVDEVEAELEAEDPPALDVTLDDAEELDVRLDQSGDEPAPEPAGPPPLELPPEPEAAEEIAPEPAPPAERAEVPEPSPPSGSGAAPEPPPPSEPDAADGSVAPLQPARAFNAAPGPETVEIPILGERPRAPAVPVAPPLTPPAPEAPPSSAAPPPAIDDNLLAIPEFSQSADTAPPPAVPADPDPPASARSLRGAASRSRHLGTWFLIILLVGALGVAGYFLLGILGVGGGEPGAGQGGSEAAAQADAEVAAGEPEAPPAVQETPEATPGEPAAEDAIEPAAEASPAAAPAPPEPAAPLTGLERITWTESGGETVLVLVGDGQIPRQQVEVVPIVGGEPRVVIKIAGVERAFQPAALEVGTSQVRRVRTGLHAGGELHVVVDLAAAGISVREVSPRGSQLEVRLGAE